jgi:mono/diheme cytochrome c family protein
MNKTLLLSLALIAACRSEAATDKRAARTTDDKATKPSEVEHGKHLVLVSGCTDCHTPLKMGERGPEPDMARALSGHPAQMVMPPVPELPPGPWIGVMSATNTAWAGPWGVSFTANLTPDPETGTGKWTKQMFIDSIRNQKHLGAGRPLLPPMPASQYANYSDDDLGAIFAYLQSLPPIKNAVPQPLPPKQVAAQ